MPKKTDAELAAKFEAVMKDRDQWTWRDATQLRAISAAVEAVDNATAHLVTAVAAARDSGHSWTVIGMALGVSRQSARDRFGTPKTDDRAALRKKPVRPAA